MIGGGHQSTTGSGFRDMNENVAHEILRRKALPKPKYRRMKRFAFFFHPISHSFISEPPNSHFHSDVNTALQVGVYIFPFLINGSSGGGRTHH